MNGFNYSIIKTKLNPDGSDFHKKGFISKKFKVDRRKFNEYCRKYGLCRNFGRHYGDDRDLVEFFGQNEFGSIWSFTDYGVRFNTPLLDTLPAIMKAGEYCIVFEGFSKSCTTGFIGITTYNNRKMGFWVDDYRKIHLKRFRMGIISPNLFDVGVYGGHRYERDELIYNTDELFPRCEYAINTMNNFIFDQFTNLLRGIETPPLNQADIPRGVTMMNLNI